VEVQAMTFPCIKGASYILVNTPDMVVNNGTTQTLERETNPDSEYLKKLGGYLRPFEKVVSYAPNQVYIGNMTPDELSAFPRPWYTKEAPNSSRWGKFGEIMPQDEFYGLMKISDSFDLVVLEASFTQDVREKFLKHPILKDKAGSLKEGAGIEEIEKYVKNSNAEPLEMNGKLVGCVKRAHEFDKNLSAHVMVENLAVKASGALALLNLIDRAHVAAGDIDYIIECSEEAIGDMNQRGGGNIAKGIGEIANCVNATGVDMRGFCAGPAHSLVHAASLIQSGICKNVAVLGGGATAKLGMNGKDHVKKDMPAVEDVLGGFAVIVSENDGVNPVIRTDIIGKHNIGSGASPQAVIEALVSNPLEKAGLKMTDINKYSPEMQNPECTEPAGAGDVPTANYKMIGALAVKKGQLERTQLPQFVQKHGYVGFAPTQGHIPSGVPVVGFGREFILDGKIKNFMLIGKGSLFLGRMTNLFDGISMVIEANTGKTEKSEVSKDEVKHLVAEALKEFAAQMLSK
jgi:3-oxoacyl-[acyl-carrier-protein] synthase III